MNSQTVAGLCKVLFLENLLVIGLSLGNGLQHAWTVGCWSCVEAFVLQGLFSSVALGNFCNFFLFKCLIKHFPWCWIRCKKLFSRISTCLFGLSRIRSDHNEDKTSKILQEWSQNVKHLYHRVLVNVSDTPHKYDDAVGPAEWPDSRYQQMMYLRQKALDSARKQWADYLFVSIQETLNFNNLLLYLWHNLH